MHTMNVPDIAEMENAENKLILTAVRSSNFGVTIADARKPDLPLVYANSAFLEMTGYELTDVAKRNCRFLQGPDTDTKAVNRIHHAITNQQAITVLLLNYRKDQTQFWNRLQLSPIFDKQGVLQAYMSIQLDVSQDIAYITMQRERQKMETLGQLAGGVAHELNNALQPIILMAELIKDGVGKDTELFQHCIDTIVENANFAKDVVAGILKFARREQSNGEFTDVHTLISDVTKFAEAILPSAVEFTSLFEPASPASADPILVKVDRTAFKQLCINLLSNASDAMEGTGEIKVELSTEDIDTQRAETMNLTPGCYATITVTDSGPGISIENRSRVFEPFYTTKQPGAGTGLGLSTSYAIARDWGGTITADSQNGAVFKVYVPIADSQNIISTDPLS